MQFNACPHSLNFFSHIVAVQHNWFFIAQLNRINHTLFFCLYSICCIILRSSPKILIKIENILLGKIIIKFYQSNQINRLIAKSYEIYLIEMLAITYFLLF